VSKIHLLDELTANQIAAGEVIERPASVVKELVENSIDAQAQKIIVEVKAGGLKEIKVSDNGLGMSPKNLLLAVKRHATSKIEVLSDLNHLQSLGFRGEALPSIMAIAKVEILSREPQDNYGTKLVISGKKRLACEPVGIPIGTTVSVKELFFNTPARKKFLRAPGYESGLIYDILMKFSLGHPQIDFVFQQDNEIRLNTTGIRSAADLMEYYYGRRVKDALVEIKGDLSTGSLKGLLSEPTCSRANRKAITLFINQRQVHSPELLKAVEQGYEYLLPKGQFPYVLLHLTLDPATIDVNVHPSKLEVRLRDPSLVSEVKDILSKSLSKPQKIPQMTTIKKPQKKKLQETQTVFREFYNWEYKAIPRKTAISPNLPIPEKKEVSQILNIYKVIGQLNQTFILAEGEAGLYIFDQHIAHERVIFERLLAQANKGPLESQILLEPSALHLTPLEEELVIKYILPLTDLGIILENFGPGSYLLRAVPAGLKDSPPDFFYSLLEHLETNKGRTTSLDLKKEFLTHTACKMSVKANTKLSLQEMEQLLHDLGKTKHFLTCPHGRPIIYKITYQEILKAFKRI
jgi:DNA mismatch repair protein MutL